MEKVAWPSSIMWRRAKEPIQHPDLRPHLLGSSQVIQLYPATDATITKVAPVNEPFPLCLSLMSDPHDGKHNEIVVVLPH